MSYTRIPASDTSRNPNQLRSAVNSLYSAHVNVMQIADKMAQMYIDADDGGATRIQTEYALGSATEAQELYDLISSTAVEIRDQSPFQSQLKSRLG